MRATGASGICVPTWPRTNVPKACQLFIFTSQGAKVPINVPTCQGCANCSTWRANMPKACQFFNFAYYKTYKCSNYFSKEFFNSWIFQLWLTFANFKNTWETNREKPYQPKIFDVVFNGARGINTKIIRLV